MPSIRITDRLGVEESVSPKLGSSLGRYLQDELKLGFRDFTFAQLGQSLTDSFATGKSSAGLTVTTPVPIDSPGGSLQIAAGPSATLKVLRARDNAKLQSDVFGDPLQIAEEQGYVSLSFLANASVGLKDKSPERTFGFKAGGQIEVVNLRRFEGGDSATVFSALADTLSGFTLPTALADLAALEQGTICTLQGSGQLKFSGNFELELLANPLATATVPVISQQIRVSAGGSIAVGATVTLACEYQVRAAKTPAGAVRLGVYRNRSSEVTVSVTPAVGVAASLGDKDLIEMVLSRLSKDPAAEKEALAAANFSEQSIDSIASAIKSGIERRLEVSVTAALTGQDEQGAAFLFDIEPAAVDDAARAAIEEALRGDWRALTAAPLPGVVAVRSIHTTVSQRKHSLTVNLLGVFSFVSVTELAHEGRVLYEPATGNVIVTDAGSATRVQASANSLEADPEKLRSLYAESFMITAAYRGSGGAVGDPDLTSSHSLLITRKNATVGDVNRFLEIPVALGLLTAAEARTRSAGRTGFGAATVYAENRYNEALCKRLFLDDRHKARKQEEYETAGRAALALLIGAQDADAYRRILADRNELWRELKNIGNVASFGSALAGMRPAEVETISSDYRCIIWWAESMSRMARVVEECESFFQTNPNVDRNDPRFLALRGKLAHAIVAVLKETKPQFGEPWGLIAMDRVLYPQSRARVQLTTNAFSLTLERGPTHLAAIGA